MSLALRRSLSAAWPAPARRVLVLGGIRSGKSAFAEALLAGGGAVRYLVPSAGAPDDPAWQERVAAHRARRPADWVTEEIWDTPERLAERLATATPADSLLVDDVGGWLTGVLSATGRWDDPAAAAVPGASLAAAVAACPATRLVLVSPEVGLTVVPGSESGRTFADAQGRLNQLLADACDAVALVVAAQPVWLAGGPGTARTFRRRPAGAEPVPPVATTSAETTSTATGFIAPPVTAPDASAGTAAVERLALLDVPGAGLGKLTEIVEFAGATQGVTNPQPWQDIRVLLLRGDHAGGSSAADSPEDTDRRIALAREGTGPLAPLAGAIGATITVIECPTASPIETQDALSDAEVTAALTTGAEIVDAAVDSGADLLVLASCGCGGPVAAAATTALVSGGELPFLLPLVVDPASRVDDQAWMDRCAAARDALRRVRHRPLDPASVLATVGGGDLAVATGIVLAAAARRTPVVVDGPVGAAATLLAREFAVAVPRWVLLADDGGQPTVRRIATTLGLPTLFDLKIDLGEGAAALIALPLLRAALTVATTLAPADGA